MTNSWPWVMMVQVFGVLVVLLAAAVAVVAGVFDDVVDCLVQEAVLVLFSDPSLSFLSLSTNSTSSTYMYLSSLFIMYFNLI